ncbi:hypothetical protein BDV96DRAFT_598016 [Lophiotrema nucula]|uniref:Uncharacterized protein n=1 Tax=Lophiotrema nucula TaxID=690887 RepID=A0A6A5ZDE7_9PLEO|nr:hypothetical protein BDV96DRAFT_598016 [Lophiotrema nucula]
MARLRREVVLSPTPDIPTDAAAQQLLGELAASLSPVAAPPLTSAARSASLLNAARVPPMRPVSAHGVPPSSPPTESPRTLAALSSPRGMPGAKRQPGGLKRPSILREDLATRGRVVLPRRRDPYEMPESPVKGTFKLPETVNHMPLKVVKRGEGKVPKAESSNLPSGVAPLPQTSWLEPDVDGDVGRSVDLSSPSRSPDNQVQQQTQRKSRRLAGEEAKVAVQDWGTIPGRQARSPPTKREADSDTSGPSKPNKSPRKRGPNSSAGEVFEKEHVLGRQTRSTLQTTSRRQQKPPAAGRRTGLLADVPEEPVINGHSDVELDQANGQPSSVKGRKKKAKTAALPGKSTKAAVSSSKHRNIAEDLDRTTDALFEPENSLPAAAGRPRKPRKATLRVETLSEDDSDGDDDDDDDGVNNASAGDAAEDEELDSDAQSGNESDADRDQLSYLDRVLLFVDTGRRTGSCQTKQVTAIRKACRSARKLLTETEVTYEEVSDTCENLHIMLASIGRIKGSDLHKDIKSDAYGYLFHSFARFFEILVEWAREEYDDKEFSLPALQVLTPLIKDILALKDGIASWKVEIDQRFKGDHVVKSVDQDFIAPLRRVYTTFDAQLKRLERATQQQRAKEELLVKRRQREEEDQRKQQAAESYNQRWNRWRELHIVRKLVEPDTRRQKRLNITKFADLDERDANGERFERVQAFHDRVAPPAQRTNNLGLDDWQEYQEYTLIDGLKEFAGPRVFEHIFRQYCGPDEALRDFSVTEITAKAAQIRSVLMLMAQNAGWEPEDWIKQIPIFP